jgi:predicted hydrocarbon binding protein
MEAFFQLLGFGRLEFLRVDDRGMEAAYRVYDSFECELFKGAGEIKSSFVRGVAGGFLAERWGVSDPDEVVVREEKCVAKGDPYCEARVWVERRKRPPPGTASPRASTRREDALEEGATG